MHTHLNHLVFHVEAGNFDFYRRLFGQLGWTPVLEGDWGFGLAVDGQSPSLWFHALGQPPTRPNDWDEPGLNHLAIGCDSIADVDAVAAWLRGQGVELLFDTPTHRPEYSQGEGQTYYSVMFASPDRLLLEAVYIGPL